jgi:hypothetical protein
VARVPGGERFRAAQGGVLEAQGGPGQLRELRPDRQLVVEKGGLAVADERLHDDEAVAPRLQLLVGEAGGAQPLDAADLEVGEVDCVVYVPLGIYLGVADAEFRLVDYSTGP